VILGVSVALDDKLLDNVFEVDRDRVPEDVIVADAVGEELGETECEILKLLDCE